MNRGWKAVAADVRTLPSRRGALPLVASAGRRAVVQRPRRRTPAAPRRPVRPQKPAAPRSSIQLTPAGTAGHRRRAGKRGEAGCASKTHSRRRPKTSSRRTADEPSTTRIEQTHVSNRISEVIVTPAGQSRSYVMHNREGQQPLGTTRWAGGLSVPKFFRFEFGRTTPPPATNPPPPPLRRRRAKPPAAESHGRLHRARRAEASAFLTQFALGELVELEGIAAGIENTNFFLTTDRGRYVLTLFERLTFKQLPFYLELMRHLARPACRCRQPQENRSGRCCRELKGKPAAIVTRLAGKAVARTERAAVRADRRGARAAARCRPRLPRFPAAPARHRLVEGDGAEARTLRARRHVSRPRRGSHLPGSASSAAPASSSCRQGRSTPTCSATTC